jgi:ATP-binding cassette subfamily B protein
VLDVNDATAQDRPGLKPEFRKGEIRFSDLSFSYDDEKPVLKGISFTIIPGLWGAMVGPSGIGKTTIINLLLRLYNPKRGSITIDGYDIRDIEPVALKSQIGFAPQEPFLWNDTVMNNIRYGRANATDEDVFWAARLAEADEFVRQLPEKYQTVIGENACKISEGQKQRIAIARALVKKPKILVFDEAFASVDQDLEEAILENIGKEFHGTTLIVVTHRVSTLKRMHVTYHLESPTRLSVATNEKTVSEDWEYGKPTEMSPPQPP